MSIKNAIAAGILLKENEEHTVNFLLKNISETFTLLTNIDPNTALSVLEQLNSQINEDIVDELVESKIEKMDLISNSVGINEDDLES